MVKKNASDPGYFGLTEEAASHKLRTLGPNALTEKKGLPWYLKFLLCLTGLFNYLLWAGSILCFIAYGIQEDKRDASNLYLGIVLAAVVVITAMFSYYQQGKSAALMAQFKNYLPPKATVWRDGQKKSVNSSNLVIGDIVEINNGDNIPADIVIIKCNEMKVNNASLTGESEDLLRSTEEKEKNVFETKNVAFFGTFCTNGQGTGIVFKTGDNTVIGQIANLAQSAEAAETPLAIEIAKFIKFISAIAVIWGLLFFILGFIYGYSFITNLVFMIGIIVANVPEGLLMTVTLSLALTAKKMAERFVLVKNMESVETLGSTSCICSDKTGTLTQNKMTVSHMFYDLAMIDASTNYETLQKNPSLMVNYKIKDPGFQALVQAVTLGTKATFGFQPSKEEILKYVAKKRRVSAGSIVYDNIDDAEKKHAAEALIAAEKLLPIQMRKTEGDASESGLVKFVEPICGLDKTRHQYPTYAYEVSGKPVEALIPFSSEIKFNMFVRDMNTAVRNPTNPKDGLMLVMKGAPERILNRCTKILVNGEERPFDDESRKEVNEANDQLGRLGERVLAFARYELEPDFFTKTPQYEFDVKGWKKWKDVKERDTSIKGWFPMWNLTLVGLVSLNDPPRPGVDLAVEKCKHAGIKVIMVTGDQPPTAAAIANKVNIITQPELEYFTLLEKGLPHEEAWNKCRAIVIHGDLLAEKHANENNLDDMDPEKGRFLAEWISKPEVVFARTTPSQKLLIVNACQKAGHVVAVTGDGVNDSPAIKQADIGIAMGSGSDVAKNAADMLLLDDNFCSIVNGVEQGRVVFDNLKKSITYTLTSNIPELTPFLTFIIIQCPLPLSTILILCVDLGTDFVPAVSFAYEYAELDIMERMPRNGKHDALVTRKVIGHAYMTNGFVQSFVAFYTWLQVLNDYGIKPTTTVFLALEEGYYQTNEDVYHPDMPNFGNSNFGDEDWKTALFWDGATDT
jgi:sodium/potassium-transporting ATPase subunit alpha